MNLSLKIVVVGGVILGLLIPMSIGTLYSTQKQRTLLMNEAVAAHNRAAEVLAIGVSKALWDFAAEGAEPIVKSVMDDTRIVAAQVFDNQGAVFTEAGMEQRREGTILSVEKQVRNGEEAIGKVKVEFSLASVEAEIADRVRTTLMVALVQALACISILVLLLNKRVLARIEQLKGQANKLAAKQLDDSFDWKATDEIGVLGVSLESTRVALKNLFAELERKNADLASINSNLEMIVEERTATIKMILDHVRSGFFLIDKNLQVLPGYTRSCETLLGTKDLNGSKISSLMRLDGGRASHLEACIDQVFEDIFPEEVSLEQMPRRFRVGDRTVSLEGSTIRNKSGVIESILMTVVDVTILEQTEKENRTNRAMVNILQNMMAFRDFIRETKDRLATAHTAVRAGEESIVRRELHTLKGNASAFGLEDIAAKIHQVEDENSLESNHLSMIHEAFTTFLEERQELLKIQFEEDHAPAPLNVSTRDLELLHQKLEGMTSANDALQAVKFWADEMKRVPVDGLLGPIDSYLQKLAEQRGKQVSFSLSGGSLRVDPVKMKPVLQNLVHLLRNSIDHGIESFDERGDKPETAQLALSFKDSGDKVLISIKDDGRGIDTDRVLKKALTMKIIDDNAAGKLSKVQIEQLIFSDGLSTAQEVSETSGRGVGMAAVRQAVEDAGGDIVIHSQPGKGTEFVISIPSLPGEGKRGLRSVA